jgi:5-methylcytosine-specific restriction endonuclease McrA
VTRKARVPRPLRERVARTAGYCCGYCRTPQSIAGFRLSIEHIIPEAKGGQTVEENLWLACHGCNELKVRASRHAIRQRESASVYGTRDGKNGRSIFPGVRTARKSLA